MNYELLNETYKLCLKKFEVHREKYTIGHYCETYDENGDYYTEEPRGDFYAKNEWLSSTFIGLAPLYYRTEKDSSLLAWANKFKEDYHKKVFDIELDTMHDLGFLYQPYSIAMYQITGDAEHKKDAVKAADELVKRFNIHGQFIEAWRSMNSEEPAEDRVIVDSMMNIILLLWAWRETGHRIYKEVAIAHAETTIKYFIREDYSVAHSFLFNKETGEMIEESNTCGFGNGSHWARGTTWAVFGFAALGKYLNNKKYYDISKKIVEKYIEETGDAYIPIWDFRLPKDRPAATHPNWSKNWDETDPKNMELAVDSSAAAILACGIYELNSYIPCPELKDFAEKSVEALCKDYFIKDEKSGGLLRRQNGHNLTACYGDYFFAQALQRTLNPDIQTCWY